MKNKRNFWKKRRKRRKRNLKWKILFLSPQIEFVVCKCWKCSMSDRHENKILKIYFYFIVRQKFSKFLWKMSEIVAIFWGKRPKYPNVGHHQILFDVYLSAGLTSASCFFSYTQKTNFSSLLSDIFCNFGFTVAIGWWSFKTYTQLFTWRFSPKFAIG